MLHGFGSSLCLSLALALAPCNMCSAMYFNFDQFEESMATTVASETFVCPTECLECCSASRFLGLGRAKDKFKCTLKDRMKLPEGRNCSKPERRYSNDESNHLGRKTRCSFTEDEREAGAGEQVAKSCSSQVGCCCLASDLQEEDRCFPLGTDATHMAMSEVTGKMETYERYEKQIEANVQHDCLNPDISKVMYQTGPEKPMTEVGCCVEAEQTSKQERYRCGSNRIGKMSFPKYCSRTVEWTACKQFEELPVCREGRQQTGLIYGRKRQTPSMCLGEQSTKEQVEHTYGVTGLPEDVMLRPNSRWFLRKCPPAFKTCRGCGACGELYQSPKSFW
mmetsp:Transcript_63188/g.117567  ORF Transcript_63188/g.117567 Transcript_63188/m.117567 type:complete len:335 (+) Transcript_63188:60-1064(+)